MKTLKVSSFVSSLFTWNRCLEIVSKFLLKYYIIAEPPPHPPSPPRQKNEEYLSFLMSCVQS